MVAAVQELAGIGIYSSADAALYARVPTATMRRWLFGDKHGTAVIDAQGTADCVTFLDFVQALAIRAIRQQYKVPLPKIRAAIKMAEERFNLQFPLARQHAMYLLNRELVIQPKEDQLVQATGSARGNMLFQPIAEPFLEDLSFAADGLANKYEIFKHDGLRATMDPRVHFGQPYLPDCGMTIRALFDAFQSEGSAEAAAAIYEVTPESVRFACRFYVDYLPAEAA